MAIIKNNMFIGDVVVATMPLDGLTQGNSYTVIEHSDRDKSTFKDLVLSLHLSVINDRGECSMYHWHTFKLLSSIREHRLSIILREDSSDE